MKFEEFRKISKKEETQTELPLSEKVEEWHAYLPTGKSDQYGEEQGEVEVNFDGEDNFSVDGKNVSIEEFLRILGPKLMIVYKQRPELERIFNNCLLREKMKKRA